MKIVFFLATALTLSVGPSLAQSNVEREWSLMVFFYKGAGASISHLMTEEACAVAAQGHKADTGVGRIDATCTNVNTGKVVRH